MLYTECCLLNRTWPLHSQAHSSYGLCRSNQHRRKRGSQAVPTAEELLAAKGCCVCAHMRTRVWPPAGCPYLSGWPTPFQWVNEKENMKAVEGVVGGIWICYDPHCKHIGYCQVKDTKIFLKKYINLQGRAENTFSLTLLR